MKRISSLIIYLLLSYGMVWKVDSTLPYNLTPSLLSLYIQRFSEMLKLAVSISAAAPEASKQEAEDESKTSLSNAHALCTHTHQHTILFYFYSFLLTYVHN